MTQVAAIDTGAIFTVFRLTHFFTIYYWPNVHSIDTGVIFTSFLKGESFTVLILEIGWRNVHCILNWCIYH